MTAQSLFAKLQNSFPLSDSDAPSGAPPELSFSIEEKIDALNPVDLASVESDLNPMFVEDLLASCMNRVTNCISFREKAHDLQIRAFYDALDDKYQRIILRAENELRALENPVLEGDADAASKSRKEGHEARISVLDNKRDLAKIEGHCLDYRGRYKFLKELFDINLLQATARAKVVRKGLLAVYGIEHSVVPTPTPLGFLDELAIWCQRAADMLDQAQDARRRRRAIIAFASLDETKTTQLYTASEFAAKLAAGSFDFSIDEAFLNQFGIRKPLIRDIFFHVISPEPHITRLWQVKVRPPAQSILAGDLSFTAVAASGDPAVADQFSSTPDLHNFSPLGQWGLQLSKTTVAGEAVPISNILMNLTVSGQKN